MLAATLLVAAPAHARSERAALEGELDSILYVKGAPGGGPSSCDRSTVHRYGRKSARNVLVLVPGFLGGAGSLTYVAQRLAGKVKGLQVWTWDRRTACFEDPTGLDAAARAKSGTPAFGYYFGGATSGGRKFTPATGAGSPFVSSWGVNLQLGDLRAVIAAAHKRKRRVFLGGHSMGATITETYASYDFHGRAGYRGLAGLVMVDGGQSLQAPSAAQVDAAIAQANSQPFNDLVGGGALPWALGAFANIGGANARFQPRAAVPPALDALLAVAPALRAPFNPSNETALGYATNRRVNPSAFSFISAGNGRPEPSGDPRQWVSDGITPIQNQARLFFQAPGPDFVEWFSAAKLPAELGAVSDLRPTTLASRHGLKPRFLRKIDTPSYFFEAALTTERNPGKRWRSRTRSRTTIVDRPGYEHFDPVMAAPRNDFLTSVGKWLRPKLKR